MNKVLKVSKQTDPARLAYAIQKEVTSNCTVELTAIGGSCVQLLKSLAFATAISEPKKKIIFTPFIKDGIDSNGKKVHVISVLASLNEKASSKRTVTVIIDADKNSLDKTISHYSKTGYKFKSHTTVHDSESSDEKYSCVFERDSVDLGDLVIE